MGCITYSNNFELHKIDLSMFYICKVRQRHNCYGCGCEITKGSYCFGNNYDKKCLRCGEELLKNSIEEFKRLQKLVEKQQKDFQEKKEEYKMNNISASI